MSRIGKKIVNIPDKVEFKQDHEKVSVKGPKGTLTYTFSPHVVFAKDGNKINVSIKNDDESYRPLWGLSRTLLSNMVTGVTTGFTKVLVFNGVGYKAAVSGNKLNLSLGYSHPIDYVLPEGITAKVNGTNIEITGCDKELVGFVSAKIRSFRPPEPYKGKGIRYNEEVILRKAGKTGAKK